MRFFEASPILESTLEMILLLDLQGTVFYANRTAEEKLDYKDGLVGTSIATVFPSVKQDGLNAPDMSDILSGDSKKTMAYRGNRTCFQTVVKVVESSTEEGPCYICYVEDTSEKDLLEKKIQQTRQEAEEALKVKSEFVSNITHELKTPVNGILGNIRELGERENDVDKLRLIRLVERGCADMTNIIGNVLDFSKLEAGKVVLEPREFNIRETLDYIKSNHIHKITEKGLDFFMNVSPDVPETVIGDELRIAQILNNLISNATKFTHTGKIMVQVAKTAQYNRQVELFFFVIDTGIGIDEADISKLFKSFSQVDASITRQYGGTGLGLNICRQLCRLMDGDISVESTKGEGSVFSFHIWVGLKKDEPDVVTSQADVEATIRNLRNMMGEEERAQNAFGSPENTETIKKEMSKLILCIEMDNWEKAENFADAIKHLTENAPKEIKMAGLKLKMAVQKEDYDASVAGHEELKRLLSIPEVK